MHKTLYVDVDEEITSIIDRIRLEEAPEIFLVVPKQAMLTQGVINLKLLKKEIEKIGKSVMIATSDVHAKKVIERLGIEIKEMTSDLKEDSQQQDEIMEPQQKPEAELSKEASDEAMEKLGENDEVVQKRDMDIGSNSFFDGPTEGGSEVLSTEMQQMESSDVKSDKAQPKNELNIFDQDDLKRDLYAKKMSKDEPPVVQPQEQEPKQSFVKSVSPMQKPMQQKAVSREETQSGQPIQVEQSVPKPDQSRQSLNQHQSAQFGPPPSQARRPQEQQVNINRGPQQPESKKISIQSRDPQVKNLFGAAEQQPYKINPTHGLNFGNNKEVNEKANNFFSGKRQQTSETDPGSKSLEEEKKRVKKEVKKERGRGKTPLFWKLAVPVLIVLFALGGFGFWAYQNYPKVTISVYPEQKELSREVKIIADDASEADLENNRIPGKMVELEIERTMNFDATGEAFEADDGKARGKVKIYNYYSSNPQPLVKTTRVLSKEGKLFRLTSGVTVPGMEGEEPGVVEAGVIADEEGADYNIAPTTFTIEGFKGNPKYEKFEVKSEDQMVNGGEPDPNKKMTVVSTEDLENARVKTADAFEEYLEEGIAEKLESGQQAMVDSVEKEIISASASHKAEEVASQFSYTIKQKIKAIVFNNQDVNDIAFQSLEGEVDEGYALDGSTEITFKKGISDFEAKTLTMYINAGAIAWPKLEKSEIAEGIAGKSEDEIKTFLSNYPQIEKVEISVVPSWLSTVPVSADKINVEEKR